LHGYVRNLTDGTVEVVAQGDHDALTKLVEHLHKGPLFSHVSGVDVVWRESTTEMSTFDIEY